MALVVDARLSLPEQDLTWTAVRSSGPGGQNVNKVSTQVELRFDLQGCQVLPPEVKARLQERLGRRLDGSGALVVRCQATRSQVQNLAIAREKLAAILRDALHEEADRVPTRPSRAAKARRLGDKVKRGQQKRDRSWSPDRGES